MHPEVEALVFPSFPINLSSPGLSSSLAKPQRSLHQLPWWDCGRVISYRTANTAHPSQVLCRKELSLPLTLPAAPQTAAFIPLDLLPWRSQAWSVSQVCSPYPFLALFSERLLFLDLMLPTDPTSVSILSTLAQSCLVPQHIVFMEGQGKTSSSCLVSSYMPSSFPHSPGKYCSPLLHEC